MKKGKKFKKKSENHDSEMKTLAAIYAMGIVMDNDRMCKCISEWPELRKKNEDFNL